VGLLFFIWSLCWHLVCYNCPSKAFIEAGEGSEKDFYHGFDEPGQYRCCLLGYYIVIGNDLKHRSLRRMKKGEATNFMLSKPVALEVPVNYSIVVESKLSAFGNVYKQVLRKLKDYHFNEDDIFAIHLALDEAFVNAVKHGNKMDSTKKVSIEFSVDSDKVGISITDEGNGFEPDSVADPRLALGLNGTSGRGLLLMNSYMDTVKYNDRGNSLYMVRYKENQT
jgi:serine/threonine-protein kinase RsbW